MDIQNNLKSNLEEEENSFKLNSEHKNSSTVRQILITIVIFLLIFILTATVSFIIVNKLGNKLPAQEIEDVKRIFSSASFLEFIIFWIYFIWIIFDTRKQININKKETRLSVLHNKEREMIAEISDVLDAAVWSMSVTPEGVPGDNFYLSRKFYEFLGIENVKIKDYFECWMNKIHPEDKNATLKEFFNTIQGKKQDDYFDLTYRIEQKKDKYIWVHELGRVIKNKQGIIESFFGSLSDVTDKYILSEALKKTDAANSAKTKFLFNMAHDLRTPMNAIMGFTDMAIKNIDNQEKALESLLKVKTSSDIMLSIMNDILDMARIESGSIELKEEPADIYFFDKNLIPMFAEMAQKKKLNVAFSYGDIRNRFVYLDFLHINQALINLITNSIKYTPEGGNISIKVNQTPEIVKGFAVYEFIVSDTGIGMSKEFIKNAFDNYSRENKKEVKAQKGTGLGLAITKRLVEKMNGKIEVQSEEGKGSTFVITLPLKLQDSPEYFSGKNDEETNEEIDLNGRKILLVEDNDLNREITKDLLESTGLTIDEAIDGKQAVNTIIDKGENYYDCILMDIQMPVMDGYQATKEIRRMFERKIPIIALSASAFEEDKKKSYEAGMDGHQTKPIIFKSLVENIKKLIS